MTDPYAPQLCKLSLTLEDDPRRVYEPKYDGFRIIIYVSDFGRTVRIFNRSLREVTERFPEIRPRIGRRQAVLDAEAVVFDPSGRPDFQLVQTRVNRQHLTDTMYPLCAMVFDVLEINDEPQLHLPLITRKDLLRERVLEAEPEDSTQLVPSIIYHGTALFNDLSTKGWEGIVSKSFDAPYSPGARNDSWQKHKARRTDTFTVIGVTHGFGKRAQHFGALLLGLLQADGSYYCVGEVGTGWDDDELEELTELFDLVKSDICPASNKLNTQALKYWVRPVIKVKVTYLELSNDGQLRHASYISLVTG